MGSRIRISLCITGRTGRVTGCRGLVGREVGLDADKEEVILMGVMI